MENIKQCINTENKLYDIGEAIAEFKLLNNHSFEAISDLEAAFVKLNIEYERKSGKFCGHRSTYHGGCTMACESKKKITPKK